MSKQTKDVKKTSAKKVSAKKASTKKVSAKKTSAKEPTKITTMPALTEPRVAKTLRVTEATLDNGLTVIAVRKPGVPIVEMRLRLPFLSGKPGHPAQGMLLSDVLLTGAGDLDRAGLAGAIQGLGADISVSVDADRLVLGGNVLAPNLRNLLSIVATVVTSPTYAPDEVSTEAERAIEKLGIARARAGVIAGEALEKRLWGEHPYARDLPEPDDVAAVTAAQLRALHRSLVRPNVGVLVLVGDVAPGRMIDLAAQAFERWSGTAARPRVPKLPTPAAGPLLLIDRPGSVQSSLRLARPALTRTDTDYPALKLANLVFGGYFSSRWTENIREDKGYTYGPHSRIEHHVLGSLLTLEAEVATDVTAPAMLETHYELGKLASLPITGAELESVRQYAIGTLAMSTATQAGLASTLSALSAFGLGLDWVTEHPSRLLATTVEDVSAAAARFFGPSGFTGVVVGDAATITAPLAALAPVES